MRKGVSNMLFPFFFPGYAVLCSRVALYHSLCMIISLDTQLTPRL